MLGETTIILYFRCDTNFTHYNTSAGILFNLANDKHRTNESLMYVKMLRNKVRNSWLKPVYMKGLIKEFM